MPERRDTGEFIHPDIGFSKAINYARKQTARIEELEEVVFRLGRRLHQQQHGPLTSMSECSFSQCRWVRLVLGRESHPAT